MINRRNWTAAGGLGPKRKGVLGTDALLTSDWVMRVRPNRGLIAQWQNHSTDLWEMAKNWTECPIPQRQWLRLQEFGGALPAVVITCENLGAFIDLPLPEDALAVFSPGKHVEPTVQLLGRLPASAWVHFGDLDPDGPGHPGPDCRRYGPTGSSLHSLILYGVPGTESSSREERQLAWHPRTPGPENACRTQRRLLPGGVHAGSPVRTRDSHSLARILTSGGRTTPGRGHTNAGNRHPPSLTRPPADHHLIWLCKKAF